MCFIKKSGNVAGAPLIIGAHHSHLVEAPTAAARNSAKLPKATPATTNHFHLAEVPLIAAIHHRHLAKAPLAVTTYHGHLAEAPLAVAIDLDFLTKTSLIATRNAA